MCNKSKKMNKKITDKNGMNFKIMFEIVQRHLEL